MEIQTRSEVEGIVIHSTIEDAFNYAADNPDVWKISWSNESTGERVRFVRSEPRGVSWEYESIESVTSQIETKRLCERNTNADPGS